MKSTNRHYTPGASRMSYRHDNFRTWKSGKTWLYAATALTVLAGAAVAAPAVANAATDQTAPSNITSVKTPAADVYTGASTGTATAQADGGTNFGGEAHATESLTTSAVPIASSTVASGAPSLASSAPVSGAPTVLGDAVTNPIEYFFYNHTAQAVSSASLAASAAAVAGSIAKASNTPANSQAASIAASAASEASSLTALIVASLASLETVTSAQYADYQAALVEYAKNGNKADTSYTALMAAGNSAYAQEDVFGGHSFAYDGSGKVTVATGSNGQPGFTIDVPTAGVFTSAGSLYGLEGVQALVTSLATVASAAAAGRADLIPAADVYTGASTGTTTTATNFGGEVHATESLSAQVGKTNQVQASGNNLPATASSAPVPGGATVRGDGVTNPIEYFFYNHTAQAISAAASAGVIASAASAYASMNPTATNKSLASVAESASVEANSLVALIEGSLASLEDVTSVQYSAYQAAEIEYAANGADVTFTSLMAVGNSAYAQEDIFGGHSSAVSNGVVSAKPASGSTSEAFTVTVSSANQGVFSSAGMVYGLEGIQAVVSSLYTVASTAFYGAKAVPAVPASGSTAAKPAQAAIQGIIATPGATSDAKADITTGATVAGNIAQLGLVANPDVTLSEGQDVDFSVIEGTATAPGKAAKAVELIGGGYQYIQALYTDYFETSGQNGKFEQLISPADPDTVYKDAAGNVVHPAFVLHDGIDLSASGNVDSSKPGTYPVTFTLAMNATAYAGYKIPEATITVDFVVPGATGTEATGNGQASATALSNSKSTALPSTGDNSDVALVAAGALALMGGLTLAGTSLKKRDN